MTGSGYPRGFTLLELIVVLTVIALVTAVSVPSFFGTGRTLDTRREVALIDSALRDARREAIKTATGTGVEFDLARRVVRGRHGVRKLPEGVTVTLETVAAQQRAKQVGRVWFYPDGSSSGGRVTLADARRQYRIDIDWITGRVTTTP
jgi:general secretion pathway protein H